MQSSTHWTTPMTIATAARRLATMLLTGLLPVAITSAQDVYLSEIQIDASNSTQWIELHNRGNNTADISTWSLHCQTTTPGMPNTYWWPFPAGTSLAPNAFMRVHWLAEAPAAPQPGDLYTGTTPYDFLFGLGSETLFGDEGAAALLKSQDNSQMGLPAIYVDWVSWGVSGFQREDLAITAGLWSLGRFVTDFPSGTSIARDPDLMRTTTYPDEAWFIDFSPTPLMPNVTGAVIESYGNACTLPGNHLLGVPSLTTDTQPLLGNGQFGFSVQNTTGIFGEFVVIGFSASAAPAGQFSILPAYSGTGCQEVINTAELVATWLVPATILQTDVPLPLDNLSTQVVGLELHVQALVIELLPTANPPYQGLSDALRIVIGQ